MIVLRQAWALARKDMRIELRSKHSLAATAAFAAASSLLLGLTVDSSLWNPSTRAGLFWILFTFAIILGIGRLFATESERHTDLLLRTHLPADAVFLGKFLAHIGFGLPVLAVYSVLFALFFGHFPVNGLSWFLLMLCSVPAYAALFTTLGAISAASGVRGPVLSVLAVPMLVPLILLLVRCSRYAFSVGWMDGSSGDFLSLAAYFGTIFTAGFMLFEAAWES